MTADDPRPAGEACNSLQCAARGCQASGPNPPCGGYPRPAASGGATDGGRDEYAGHVGSCRIFYAEHRCTCGRPGAVASQADGELRRVLLTHHPIAHTETGTLKGCRCGQVRLGEDVIAHVAEHLRRALDGGDQ